MRQRMRLCVLLVFGVLFLQCAETKKQRKASRSNSNSRSKYTKSSKPKPVCDALDRNLDQNGIYVLDGSNFGVDATATLRCDCGYGTSGNPIRITCQTNGTSGPIWSTPTGVCEVNVCPVTGPATPTTSNGHYMLPMSPIVGTTAELICDSMYEVSGEPSVCCLADGTWSTPGGTCERACGVVPDDLDPHGIYILDALDFGEDATATLRCDGGYSATGIQITCQDGGTSGPVWSAPTGVCEVDGCGVLPENCLPEECLLDRDAGTPCGDLTLRYFYKKSTCSCEPFVWMGCGGNDNRFLSSSKCEAVCIPV